MQDKDSFKELKDKYTNFTINNTPINGATECGRIFTKVLNPLACKYKKQGTFKGHLSKDVITQDMIMYNQRNWRDILAEKPKDMTRIEYEAIRTKPPKDYMTVLIEQKEICTALTINIVMVVQRFLMNGILWIKQHRCIIYFRQVIIQVLQIMLRT